MAMKVFALKEERRLRVFENNVLGRIFVIKSEEVTGDRRKLHSVELLTFKLRQILLR
jgi:hypothetical protein